MTNQPLRRAVAAVPTLGITLLPVAKCPACWPIYAGVLSSLGLGFLLERAWLLPITIAFLTGTLASLAYHAKGRQGYGPLGLGAVGAVIAFAGKFSMDSTTLLYLGLIGLGGAALWNAWPRRGAAQVASCPKCAGGKPTDEQQAHTGDILMQSQRTVEIFSAGCATCDEAVALVRRIACTSCDVTVLDMHDATVASRAKQLGIQSVPAIVIDGKLASCCANGGPDEGSLRAAGLGASLA